MSSHPWLSEMPPAHCPVGCVVRKGDLLGSVTQNNADGWCVVLHGGSKAFRGVEFFKGDDTPEAAGWRHALCHPQGFGWVLQEIGHGTADESDGFMNEMLDRWGSDWRGITDIDRLRVAREFAAAIAAANEQSEAETLSHFAAMTSLEPTR